jgi:hypothetical protein
MAFNMGELIADRGFQNALATFGAGLDPQGVGGALGNATVGWNKSKAMQESIAKTEKDNKDFRSQLLQMISGGMTPADQLGLTSMNTDGKTVTLKGTLPQGNAADAVGNAGTTGAPGKTNGGFSIKDLLPFLQAPTVG